MPCSVVLRSQPLPGVRQLCEAILQVDDVTGAYDFELFVSGITSTDLFRAGANSTPVHIHSAPVGANGSIVVDVANAGTITDIGTPANGFKLSVTGGTFGGVQGALNGPDVATNLANLLTDNLYVNVHTNAFNGGEIRGQLVPKSVPEPAAVSLGLLGLAGALSIWRKKR